MKKFFKLQALGFLLTLIGLFSPADLYGQATNRGQETTLTQSGNNLQLTAPNTLATQFNVGSLNTFIIPLTNPAVAIRFYVTNNTANACFGQLTAQLFAVTDASTSSLNNSLSNWQLVPFQDNNGNPVSPFSVTLPASGSAYFTSYVISAPRVALQFVNPTGLCATTSLELTGVITPVAMTSPIISSSGAVPGNASQVQGTVAQGVAIGSQNPLVYGGKDQNSLARTGTVWDPAGGSPGGSFSSALVGGQTSATNVVYSGNKIAPAALPQGPLSVAFHSLAGSGGTVFLEPFVSSPSATNVCSTSCPGLYTSFSGYAASNTLTVTTAGGAQQVNLWTGQSTVGVLSQCKWTTFTTVNVAGTLTSFLQDSPDGITWNDRLRMADVAGAAINQTGSIATSTGTNPAAFTNGTLAASTRVDGPLDSQGRLLFTATGAGASYSVTWEVVCK